MPEARQRPKIQLGKGLVTETDANVVTAGLFFFFKAVSKPGMLSKPSTNYRSSKEYEADEFLT